MTHCGNSSAYFSNSIRQLWFQPCPAKLSLSVTTKFPAIKKFFFFKKAILQLLRLIDRSIIILLVYAVPILFSFVQKAKERVLRENSIITQPELVTFTLCVHLIHIHTKLIIFSFANPGLQVTYSIAADPDAYENAVVVGRSGNDDWAKPNCLLLLRKLQLQTCQFGAAVSFRPLVKSTYMATLKDNGLATNANLFRLNVIGLANQVTNVQRKHKLGLCVNYSKGATFSFNFAAFIFSSSPSCCNQILIYLEHFFANKPDGRRTLPKAKPREK